MTQATRLVLPGGKSVSFYLDPSSKPRPKPKPAAFHRSGREVHLLHHCADSLMVREPSRARLPKDSPVSAAERWARWVLAMIDSPHDLPTVTLWAKHIGVSNTTLGETCRLLGCWPHDARDLGRMLRAVFLASNDAARLEGVLAVSDLRTFGKLVERSGLRRKPVVGISLEAFLECQTFIPADHEGLRALRAIVRKRRDR